MKSLPEVSQNFSRDSLTEITSDRNSLAVRVPSLKAATPDIILYSLLHRIYKFCRTSSLCLAPEVVRGIVHASRERGPLQVAKAGRRIQHQFHRQKKIGQGLVRGYKTRWRSRVSRKVSISSQIVVKVSLTRGAQGRVRTHYYYKNDKSFLFVIAARMLNEALYWRRGSRQAAECYLSLSR